MDLKEKAVKKNLLFVCVENSCRSQMAEALFNDLYGGNIKAYSAGSNPSGKINPYAVKALDEIGIDISNAKTKGLGDLSEKKFDYVVSMGCKDTCPFMAAEKHIDWDIMDPKGKDLDFFRKIRNEIKMNIEKLHLQIKN